MVSMVILPVWDRIRRRVNTLLARERHMGKRNANTVLPNEDFAMEESKHRMSVWIKWLLFDQRGC